MKHATVDGGTVSILSRSDDYWHNDVRYTPGTLDRLSRAEKLVVGVMEVEELTVGSGPVLDSTSEPTVVGDHVEIVRTFREKTAQEIEADLDAQVESLAEQQEVGKLFLSTFRVLYGLAQQINPIVTPAQFKAFVDNETASGDIPATAFRQWVKDQI